MALLTLRSARSHYRLSALIARRGAREARKAAPRGLVAVAGVVASHQVAQAVASERAVAEMLAEQGIDEAAEALLNATAFTTSVDNFLRMAEAAADADLERLAESLIQDAGRAAESVATAVRPNIYHVRFVSPPCCARCAILAGRRYRYSTGFERHTNCDCVLIPTTIAGEPQDPTELFEQGLIRGLSKADAQAIRDGADLNRVVNVRLARAGLKESGRVLIRRGKLTPEGIYQQSGDNRAMALDLLAANGYLRT